MITNIIQKINAKKISIATALTVAAGAFFTALPVHGAVADGVADAADVATIDTLTLTLTDQVFERFGAFLTVGISIALLFIGITLAWSFISMGFRKLVGGIYMLGRSSG